MAVRLLLDTTAIVNVGRRFQPTRRWFIAQDLTDLFISAVTVGELFRGAHQRYAQDPVTLARTLHDLRTARLSPFAGRILPFDDATAEIWGRLVGEGAARGAVPPVDDAKIAATAIRHGLTVATSNTKHFASLVATVDPRTA